MLYTLLKFPAALALKLYCRKLVVNKPSLLQSEGPLLLAANHPNSFLDAVILATLFKRPVYSLVRGDVYKKPLYAKLLTALNMLPVYRISEGVENLGSNYETFEKCRQLFRKNAIVLIFSEGRCINEWKLRPVKKGTARLAISSWKEAIDLQVLPVGINYHSFTSFGKNIELNFGNHITQKDMPDTNGDGNSINYFTSLLETALQKLVLEFDPNNKQAIQQHFIKPPSLIKKILLAIPALAGVITHAALYLPVQKFAWKTASHNDHYDSVLVGMLFVLYPIYLLLLIAIISFTVGMAYSVWVLLLPFCAWAFVQIKKTRT